MLAWAQEVAHGIGDSELRLPSFEELEGMEEQQMANVLADRYKQWVADSRDKGRVEGRVEGREEGQRELLEALATRRFGADAAQRLSATLNGSASREAFAELGDLIIRCETAEEFVEELEG